MLAHHAQDAAVATELGRGLVVVLPHGRANLRATLRHYGGRDVEEVGGELSRAPELDVDASVGATAIDSCLEWRDVAWALRNAV